jgi:hypothetical protein
MAKKLFSYMMVLILGAFLMSGCEEKADEEATSSDNTVAVDYNKFDSTFLDEIKSVMKNDNLISKAMTATSTEENWKTECNYSDSDFTDAYSATASDKTTQCFWFANIETAGSTGGINGIINLILSPFSTALANASWKFDTTEVLNATVPLDDNYGGDQPVTLTTTALTDKAYDTKIVIAYTNYSGYTNDVYLKNTSTEKKIMYVSSAEKKIVMVNIDKTNKNISIERLYKGRHQVVIFKGLSDDYTINGSTSVKLLNITNDDTYYLSGTTSGLELWHKDSSVSWGTNVSSGDTLQSYSLGNGTALSTTSPLDSITFPTTTSEWTSNSKTNFFKPLSDGSNYPTADENLVPISLD